MTRSIAAALILLVGCESTPRPPAHADAAPTPLDAAPAIDAPPAAPGDAAPRGPAVPLPATCEKTPLLAAGVAFAIPLAVTLADHAVTLGVPLDAPGGKRLRFSTARFFVSRVALLRAGAAIPADLVDRQGHTVPYGIQLVDLEAPDSLTLHLQAPAGRYDGLALAIGLGPACNGGDPASRVFPLDADGGMTWIWALGYMFVRLEGSLEPGGAKFLAHGGAFPLDAGPVWVTAAGELTVAAGATVPVRARLDDLVEPATLGEHLAAGMAVMARLPDAHFLVVGP